MKKRILSIVIILCMVFTLIPTTSLAATQLTTLNIGGINVPLPSDGNITYSNTDTTDSIWWVSNSGGSYTLTLNNANILTNYSFLLHDFYHYTAAIYADGDLNLILQGTSTVINDGLLIGGSGSACGMYINGALDISGNGTLNISSSHIPSGGAFSVGLYITGALNVSESANLNAISTENSNSYRGYGIFCYEAIIENNAVVSATGGLSPLNETRYSTGIMLFGSSRFIVRDNATVNATGASSNQLYYSKGIDLSSSHMIISDNASVTAQAGTVYLGGSFGLSDSNDTYGGGILTVNGGTLTAIGHSTTRTASSGISINRTITINGGTVVAVAGFGQSSVGISTRYENIYINGGKVIASSTSALSGSNGIYANSSSSNIYIDSSALVIAKSGYNALYMTTAMNKNPYGTASVLSGSYDSKFAVYGRTGTYKVVAEGIDLTTGNHSEKTLADDGYTWNSSTNTMTIENIIIDGNVNGITTDTYGIKTPSNTNIILKGVNVICPGNTSGAESHGINSTADLTISGSGDMIIASGHSQSNSIGLYSDSNIILNGGSCISLAGEGDTNRKALFLSPVTTNPRSTRTLSGGGYDKIVAVWIVKTPESTPNASFVATGSSNGTVSNVTTDMRFSVDGGNNWYYFNDTVTQIPLVTSTNGIQVYKPGNGTTTLDSDIQTITVTQAVVPSVTHSNCTTLANNDGKIIGVTSQMEYKLGTDTDWTDGNGLDITGLTDGTYYVRSKASGTMLASASQTIVIYGYVGLREDTPISVADYVNEVLIGLNSNASYKINGTSITSDGDGKIEIQNSWFGTTILLEKVGNGTTTFDSLAQSITLSARPTAPFCIVIQPSANVTTGTVTGITTSMQYSIDGGSTWIDGNNNDVTGLAPGAVLVRIKAQAGTAPYGLNQSIVITAYTAPPSINVYTDPVSVLQSGDYCIANNLDGLISKGKTLTVNGDKFARLIFDTDALKGIDEQTTGNVKIEIKDVSSDYQKNLPNKKIFTLAITSNGKEITYFGGSVTVSLPYELKEGETANQVTVWYLANDGSMTEIPCTYIEKTKLVTFTVTHFSQYVVGADMLWVNPYSDLKDTDLYFDAIKYVTDNNMMQGVSVTEFEPDTILTRGMMVTILWKLEKQPNVASATVQFDDVADEMWYTEAIAWAADKNIVNGYNGSFNPNDFLTREQMATIMYRYAGYKKYDLSKTFDLSVYIDKPSDWALSSISWAVAEGIIEGKDERLNPKGDISRAQMAAVLKRFAENNKK